MKAIKKIMIVLFGLLALASCSDNDDDAPSPATKEQLQEVGGHWYAEISASGETDNWRTEEEGDVTAYDKIGALIYLNSDVTDASFWGYLFLQDGDMVNFDGIFRRDEEANFDFTMDSRGNITPSSHLPNAPKVSNMRFANGVITADVSYNGHDHSLTFRRTTTDEEASLKEWWDILIEEGIIGGFSDNDDQQSGGISDENANHPARAKRR